MGRWYDASIGRFTTVDPLADAADNVSFSPYTYVWNSPINAIDPDGRTGEWIPFISQGKIKLVKETGDNLNSLIQYFAESSRFTYKELESAYDVNGMIVTLPDDNYSRAFTYADNNKDKFPTEKKKWEGKEIIIVTIFTQMV